MKRNSYRVLALAIVGSLTIAACGGDDGTTTDSSPAATNAPDSTDAPDTTDGSSGEAWAVNTDDCVDPAAANAPIDGTIKIGSTMPLSGGLAATAFSPVKDGFEAYIQYANEKKLLGDITIEVAIEDDQYNKDLTPAAVDKLLDAGVHVIAGMIGTANVSSVRSILNEECYPQIMSLTGAPELFDAEEFPWTSGILVPYDVETKAYVDVIKTRFPDGASIGLFYVNSDQGQAYADALDESATDGGIEIVARETIEVTDAAPPTAQLNSIASKRPDVILGVPIGAGCVSFLTELANVKAANPGWEPEVFLTFTCAASSLILDAAGMTADGIYTLSNLVDVLDPVSAAVPAVAEYLAYMNGLGKSAIITTATAGWHTAEMTVLMIKQALESGELTRASIINASRNFDQVGMLTREGVRMKLSGLGDQFIAESIQVVQYSADSKLYTNIGDLVSKFES